MVGKNILAAAAVYFAMTSALALPKDKVDDVKSKHGGDDDNKTHLPLKPGDKDCSSTAPYPTGDSTNTDYGTGIGIPTGIFPTGTGFVTGVTLTTEGVAVPTITDDSALTSTVNDDSAITTTVDDSVLPTDAPIVTKRSAQPDKGKGDSDDDDSSSGTSSPTGVEDNPSKTTDDNGGPTALPSAGFPGAVNGTISGAFNGTDGNGNDTITITSTITVAPTVTITTSVSSSTSKSKQKGKKSKTTSSTTTSVDDNPGATPVA
jgi:hypothetical protein